MSDAYIDQLRATIQGELAEMNTTVPGVVVAYDKATNRARVRPSIPKRLADGTTLPAPEIAEVPVLWAGGDGGRFSFPLVPGDAVKLSFSQRSMEEWIAGSAEAPTDPRMGDLSDCIAEPGLTPGGSVGNENGASFHYKGSKINLNDDGSILIQNGGATVTIEPGGKVNIQSPEITLTTPTAKFTGNVTVAGRMDVTGGVKIAGIEFGTHRHPETGTGGGTTQGPI